MRVFGTHVSASAPAPPAPAVSVREAPPVPPPPQASVPLPIPVPTLPARKGARKEVGVKARRSGAKAIDLLVMSGVDRTFAAGLIDWLLEEVAGKAPRQTAAMPQEADSDFDLLMRRYRKLHKESTTVEPNVLTPDVIAAKRLLAKHGLDVVTRQMQALADIQDEFVRNQGLTFTVLQRHWSRLATSARTTARQQSRPAPPGCKHSPPCQTAVEHTRRYLREANALPSRAPTS